MKIFVQGLVFSFLKLSKIYMFLVVLLISSSSMAQVAGDYRSKASGNWGDFTTWQRYDGVTWQNAVAGEVPGGNSEVDADNVYLEAGFTVTLTSDASCKNLHLNTTADIVRINTQNNALNVWGKMRFYEGVAPGAGTPSTVTTSGVLGWITTGANGYIRFRGTVARVIMVMGEVNANNTNSGWNMDFAFDNGIVGQLNDRIRMGNITVSSGELYMNNVSAQIRVGTNSSGDVTPNGSAIIKSGATLRGGEGIFKNTTVAAQNITLEEGATLVVVRTGYILAAVNLDLSGTVILQQSGNFPTAAGRASAALVSAFHNLTLDATGPKVLQNSISVSGTLKMAGTANLSIGTYALSYGASGELEYNGAAAQTTANPEFPVTNGPKKLTINNANGVNLHANRSIEGQLTLSSGLFSLGNYHLTLGANSSAIAGTPSTSNMIVTNGTGELRKIFNAPGYFFYPVGETTGTTEYTYARIDVSSADVLDATTYVGIRVIDNVHSASSSSTDNISRYWRVSSNMTALNYDAILQYLISDINGTEENINVYNYSDESPLATGTPIVRVNTTFHRVVLSGLTATGFITGANFCALSNNSVDYTGATSFCGASSLTQGFTGSVAAVTSSNPTYQWQQKLHTGSWADIASEDDQNYTELASLTPTNTYYYRRVVSDPTYCLTTDLNYSNEISIDVYEGITGNQIAADQIVAESATPDPFTQVGTVAGGTGSYTYQWQSSPDLGGPYVDIPLENNATYSAPAGSSAMFYVRKIESGVCSSISNEVSITIVTSNVSSDVMAGVKLYPNPVTDELFFNLDLSSFNEVEVAILNSIGNTIVKQKVNPVSTFNIDLSAQVGGIYFAHFIVDGEKSVVYKIVKQ